ncbi:putative octopamine receptor 1-like [Apostichopus japonicus]|uniref:Putative octopamine receptor 1-like n=2 Tax=Stichopus japonicus TaxID=307972 RepID=A0A2G8K848_STIJA|nr:putative octopamine receptor 1-like [Apostichopus japonicus]
MAMELASVDNNTLHRNKGSGQSRAQRFTTMRKEKKAALTLFIVIGIFISCVTPYCIVYLIASYNPADRVLAAMGVTSMLSFLNSAANPMIYGILNRKFRRMFLHVIKCKRCKHVSDNPALQSDNGTASTAMALRKRNHRREDTVQHISGKPPATSAHGLLRLSLATAPGGTVACVLDENVNGVDKLTLKHLPTISDVLEPHESRNGGPRLKTDNSTNDEVRTLSFQATVDANHKHRDHETCDVMVLTGPRVRSIHIDRK